MRPPRSRLPTRGRIVFAEDSKEAPATPVPAPVCRQPAARTAGGCVGIAFWDLNVAHGARRAKCSFRGPAGELSVARPLFKGTEQTRFCKLTNKFRTVGGVRKRVVHAELKITVPQGVTVKGSKLVRVTASWR